PLLKGTLFAQRIHHYFRIGSTNVAAMEAAGAGEPEGAVFVAEAQTAGRGSGGHHWHSARSAGIYCSVILRPAAHAGDSAPLPPSDALLLLLSAGLAAKAAIAEVTGLRPDLHWPND